MLWLVSGLCVPQVSVAGEAKEQIAVRKPARPGEHQCAPPEAAIARKQKAL